jgi:predicted nucleic acid-binding protein
VGGSGLTKLDDALSGVTGLGFDTPPFIYFIERHPQHLQILRQVFSRIDQGAILGFTSVITLTEVLTKPKQAGDIAVEREYIDLLTRSRNFTTLPIDNGMAVRAADLRARYSLRTPDAIQVAASISVGCNALLTNDARFRRVTELRILILDELKV